MPGSGLRRAVLEAGDVDVDRRDLDAADRADGVAAHLLRLLAARTPTRQPDSFAVYVRPSTFFASTLPFLSANGAVCTVSSVIAKSTFGNFFAYVAIVGASRKPAATTSLAPLRTAELKFGT